MQHNGAHRCKLVNAEQGHGDLVMCHCGVVVIRHDHQFEFRLMGRTAQVIMRSFCIDAERVRPVDFDPRYRRIVSRNCQRSHRLGNANEDAGSAAKAVKDAFALQLLTFVPFKALGFDQRLSRQGGQIVKIECCRKILNIVACHYDNLIFPLH